MIINKFNKVDIFAYCEEDQGYGSMFDGVFDDIAKTTRPLIYRDGGDIYEPPNNEYLEPCSLLKTDETIQREEIALPLTLCNYYEFLFCLKIMIIRLVLNGIEVSFVQSLYHRGDIVLSSSEYIEDLTKEGIEPNPGPKNTRNAKVKYKPKKKTPGVARGNAPRNMQQTVQKLGATEWFLYEERLTGYNNAGGTFVAKEYRINDVYDIDPLILSRSIQFAQYVFDLYLYAKVITAVVEYVFSNKEQTALQIFTFDSVQPLTPLISSGTLESVATTILRKNDVVMSEQYGKSSRVKVSHVVKPALILGNKAEFMASNSYSCTSSASPLTPIWSSWFVYTSDGAIPVGFNVRTRIQLKVHFYGSRPLSSILLLNSHFAKKATESIETSTQLPIPERDYKNYMEYLEWKKKIK